MLDTRARWRSTGLDDGLSHALDTVGPASGGACAAVDGDIPSPGQGWPVARGRARRLCLGPAACSRGSGASLRGYVPLSRMGSCPPMEGPDPPEDRLTPSFTWGCLGPRFRSRNQGLARATRAQISQYRSSFCVGMREYDTDLEQTGDGSTRDVRKVTSEAAMCAATGRSWRSPRAARGLCGGMVGDGPSRSSRIPVRALSK